MNVTTGKETIDAYEIGLKKTFGGRLQANASAFYYDYKDIQVPITGLNPVTNTNVASFYNLPKARIIGFELETVWQPIDHLQILANYSYLNAEIREACCFQDSEDPRGVQPGVKLAGNTAAQLAGTGALNQDLKGATLPSSTPHRVTINGNYTWETDPGDISASLTYVWRDATYYSIFNRYYNKVKSYGQTDARLIFNDKSRRWTAIGYVKNVFDTRGSAGVTATPDHHRPEHRLRKPDGVLRSAADLRRGAAAPLLSRSLTSGETPRSARPGRQPSDILPVRDPARRIAFP